MLCHKIVTIILHIAHDLIAYQTQRKRQMTLRLGVAAIGLLLSGSGIF